ncbi:MAG: tripartite tricarboxylate transporter substrate binding protein, partial [Pseudomonadota bacterium]|nr:tripartite tricarboxylate transporter substrate binding protein [Pseudomonadota bacterium]
MGADDFPSKPIRIVVPFPPGGLTDSSVRKLTQLVGPDLGQPFIVENKPGDNGLIGTAQALRAPADGYTLVAVTTSVVLIGPILSKAPFDPLKDLSYILNYAGPSHALVVRADSPYKSLDDLLADAKAHPGQLSFGTVGTSDAAYFGTMALSRAKGVTFNHIPYQGANQTLMAVISGETVFAPTSNYSAMVKAGKVRPLVLLDKERLASLPQVLTFTESGVDWQFPWITGLAVSAGTPEPIRRRLETAFLKAARSPEFVGFLQQLNVPLYV